MFSMDTLSMQIKRSPGEREQAQHDRDQVEPIRLSLGKPVLWIFNTTTVTPTTLTAHATNPRLALRSVMPTVAINTTITLIKKTYNQNAAGSYQAPRNANVNPIEQESNTGQATAAELALAFVSFA